MSSISRGREWLVSSIPGIVPLRAAVAVLLLSVVCLFSLGLYQVAYAGRIMPGVTVLGRDLGGMAPDEAASTVRNGFAGYEQEGLHLNYDGRTWVRTPAQLGLRLGARETIQSAYSIGRDGGLGGFVLGPLRLLGASDVVAPTLRIDRAAMEEALLQIATEIGRSVVDAHLVIRASGDVEVSPSRTGRVLDVGETSRVLETRLLAMSRDPVDLVVREEKPTVLEGHLEAGLEHAKVALSSPITLVFEDHSWSISPEQLAMMLVPSVTQGAGTPGVSLALHEGKMALFLKSIASQVDVAPVDAKLALEGGTLLLTSHRDGRALDVGATTRLLNRQIFQASRVVPLQVEVLKAQVREEDLLPVKARAEKVFSSPITLVFEDKQWTLTEDILLEALYLEDVIVDGRTLPSIQLDADTLAAFVVPIGPKISRSPKDARFVFLDTGVEVSTESVDGISLDVAGTIQAIRQAAPTDQREVPLAVIVEHPKVKSSDKDKIVIRDVLIRNTSNYAGGSADRMHNIALATNRLNGVVIPPGEVFSFNASLGPTTTANGFRQGYAIVMDDGQPRTIPSVAGGICQVATTLFQAAFWAGFPIEERHPHFYWIARYGQTDLGMKGLDTTVEEEYGVDFRFRNNTDNWVAIRSAADDSTIYFTILGTDPGWTVEVTGPTITNVVPADPKPVEEVEPSFPPGKRVMVEVAQDGFTSIIERRVTKGDQVIEELRLTSRFVPARNVYLVGPKPEGECDPSTTATPGAVCYTPTPEGTPGPDATADPQVTPTPPEAAPTPEAPAETPVPDSGGA